eukprot:snap_masked-scaffold817_size93049-processed-gene-0.1 protein:Tk02223 transcript:snap_masked-scaffold817_size93049-processed-gene-0.1-mRNA-1 annotation:"rho cdc42 rac gtpase-activating protein rics"
MAITSGLCTSSELETSKGSIRIQHLTAGQSSNLPTPKEGVARFPRLQDCAHFHYEFTEIGPIQLELVDRDEELRSVNPSVDPGDSWLISVQVTSKGRTWIVRRSYENFVLLDKQSHQCIYDRRYSQLPEIVEEENLPISNGRSHEDSVRQLLSGYLCRFSSLAGPSFHGRERTHMEINVFLTIGFWTIQTLEGLGLILGWVALYVIYQGSDTNHPVYSLLFQNMVLFQIVTIVNLCVGFLVSFPVFIRWFQIYVFFSSISLTFHDVSWSIISFVRYLKISKEAIWEQCHPNLVRVLTSVCAWSNCIVQMVIIVVVRNVYAHYSGSIYFQDWSTSMQSGFLWAVFSYATLFDGVTLFCYIQILAAKRNERPKSSQVMPLDDLCRGPESVMLDHSLNEQSEKERRSTVNAMVSTLVLGGIRTLFPLVHPLVAHWRGNTQVELVLMATVRAVVKNMGIFVVTLLNFGTLRQFLTTDCLP